MFLLTKMTSEFLPHTININFEDKNNVIITENLKTSIIKLQIMDENKNLPITDYFVNPILIDFSKDSQSNRENILNLLNSSYVDIFKFINFPKNFRSEIYKIVGKSPLKFKKELVDSKNSLINILVSKKDYDDKEYEISVSDSDETRTFTTTDESSNSDETDPDFIESSDSSSIYSFESEEEQMLKILKNMNKEIKTTNCILIGFSVCWLVSNYFLHN